MVWRIRVPKLNLDFVPKSCKYAVKQVVWRTRIRKVRFPELILHRGLKAFVDICLTCFFFFRGSGSENCYFQNYFFWKSVMSLIFFLGFGPQPFPLTAAREPFFISKNSVGSCIYIYMYLYIYIYGKYTEIWWPWWSDMLGFPILRQNHMLQPPNLRWGVTSPRWVFSGHSSLALGL